MPLSINFVAALGVSSELGGRDSVDEDAIPAKEDEGDGFLSNGTVSGSIGCRAAISVSSVLFFVPRRLFGKLISEGSRKIDGF